MATTKNQPQDKSQSKANDADAEKAKADAKSAIEKEAAEKAKAKSEQASKLKAEKAKAKAARAAALAERAYVPKKGTGKMFHVLFEKPQYNNAGDKISESVRQIMDTKTFTQWLQNASRLGFAFILLHDASPFCSQSEVKRIKDLIDDYKEKASPIVVSYAKKMNASN